MQYLLGENPIFFGGHKILAFLHYRKGDLPAASASLHRYLDLHPEGIDNEETVELMDQLERQNAW